MNNIVGSRIGISKHWTKDWIFRKQNLVLTKKQISLLIGSLLGDGTMRVGHDSINANFKVEHCLKQKDLVFCKYQVLKPWVFTEPKLSYRYNTDGSKYEKSWWFRTIRHPELTKIQKLFYSKGKKIVPQNINLFFDESVLAWWIMDDGSYNRSVLDISTYSFTLQEVKLLLNTVNNKFRIQGSYYRDRDKGFRIYFKANETKKLVKVIEPYVMDSMKYKIGYSNLDPVTT